jgi:hypothetical protein
MTLAGNIKEIVPVLFLELLLPEDFKKVSRVTCISQDSITASPQQIVGYSSTK